MTLLKLSASPDYTGFSWQAWHEAPTLGASVCIAGTDRACAGPEWCAQLSSCLLARGCQTWPVPSLFASLTAFATSAPQGETPGDS